MRELSALEARVLGVLVEKERTVPDAYPMSLNALALGCNQKTSRNPTMNASEADIVAALESLKGLSLVIESSGGRVMRYAQNVRRVLQVPGESVFLLAMLMLRGPQTAAELRANCSRLCRFSDVSAVEAFLAELAGRSSGALVRELPRQAGSRETRWMHLLCGAGGLAGFAAVTGVIGISGASGPTDGSGPETGLAVDLPDVVAEVRTALARYARARSGSDASALDRLLWQSPKAFFVHRGNPQAGSEAIARHWSLERSPGTVTPPDEQQVTTFGRDFAYTRIDLPAGTPAGGRTESQVWVRLPQGWRVVAAHTSEPPAAASGTAAQAGGPAVQG